jgi:Protein of unknown function (DUF2909)
MVTGLIEAYWRDKEMGGIKILIVLVLAGIVASLGKALFHMSSGGSDVGHSAMMARALTVRIGLSIALFVLLMIAWYFGAISPHGLG